MIKQTERMNALLDAYANLLTHKQREVMELYYREDLSLSEISEELHVSRSAVSDHIHRSCEILEDYEEKLQMLKNYETRMQIYDKIKAVGDDHVKKLMEQLENVEN